MGTCSIVIFILLNNIFEVSGLLPPYPFNPNYAALSAPVFLSREAALFPRRRDTFTVCDQPIASEEYLAAIFNASLPDPAPGQPCPSHSPNNQ
jgi:hypothetical protein